LIACDVDIFIFLLLTGLGGRRDKDCGGGAIVMCGRFSRKSTMQAIEYEFEIREYTVSLLSCFSLVFFLPYHKN
jgi:hypothetical protein